MLNLDMDMHGPFFCSITFGATAAALFETRQPCPRKNTLFFLSYTWHPSGTVGFQVFLEISGPTRSDHVCVRGTPWVTDGPDGHDARELQEDG